MALSLKNSRVRLFKIWMDIRMPFMDGLDATRRIKETEADAGTKIVALTRNLGVRFVCKAEPPPADGALPLNAAALAELTTELLNELEQALVRIDIGAVNRAIEAIRVHHPSLADALGALARKLQFGRILRMIHAASGKTNPDTKHA